jgi:predicted HTH transcriptional regulator
MKDYEKNLSSNNIFVLIKEGEHENQDFKYKISSAKKIARTLSAFSNSTGGKLLVGVRDNGTIGGVKDEDDIYMLESASTIFLDPPITLDIQAHQLDGKTVWEVDVKEGKNKPYSVLEDNGPHAYFRLEDQNFKANAVLRELWKQQQTHQTKGTVAYTEKEKRLIEYLNQYQDITLNKAAKIMRMPRPLAIKTIARFIRWEVLNWSFRDNQFYYYLD